MSAAANNSRNSENVITASISPATDSPLASIFLAMHGPMNTILSCSPWISLKARAVAIIGETMGASERDQFGIVTLDESDDCRAGRGNIAVPVARQQEFPVAAGHEVGAECHLDDEIRNPISATCRPFAYGPRRRTRRESWGPRRRPRAAPMSSKDCTSCAVLRSNLAFCEQTRTQLPQAIQRSPITWAWPSVMRIALTGHSRTHV